MNAFELVVAVALLAGSPDRLEIADVGVMHRTMAPTVAAVAMHWELLDPRETSYLNNEQDFLVDLKALQNRFAELHNAPTVAEVERFPPKDLVFDNLKFNRDYHQSVIDRLDLDMVHGDVLRDILAENDHLYRVYVAIGDARSDYFYVTSRRQSLALLRDLVGIEAFYTGQLPPHVPLWRIPEAK